MNNELTDIAALLNIPSCCVNRHGILEGSIKIGGAAADYEVCPSIFILSEQKDFYPRSYFEKAVSGLEVWAPLFLYGGYLPTRNGMKFFTGLPGEEKPSDYEYKRVEVTAEILTVGDLYRNAWKYAYNKESDSFVRLSETAAVQNALKFYMQKQIMETSGDAFDRIADLSRLVIFLLSKVSLSTEEREAFSGLLAYAPTASLLSGVIKRETGIQTYVSHVKADPVGYLHGE